MQHVLATWFLQCENSKKSEPEQPCSWGFVAGPEHGSGPDFRHRFCCWCWYGSITCYTIWTSFSIDMFLCTSKQVDVLTGMDSMDLMGSWNNVTMPILRVFLQILQASRVWSFSHIKGTTSEPLTPRIHQSHCSLNRFGPWRFRCVKTVAEFVRFPCMFLFSYQTKWRVWESSQRILWLVPMTSGQETLCWGGGSQLVPGVVDEKFKSSEVLWPGRTWNMLRGFWSFLLSSASSVEHELSQAYLNGHNCLKRTWSTSISVGWRAFDMLWKPMPRCAELQ